VRRVLVTRAEPGAEATGMRLRALGFEPVLAPLRVLEAASHNLRLADGADALAFTSAAGVRFWTGRRDLPAFCVGDATAEAARAWGFTDVRSASRDAAALAVLISSETRPGATIVHVRALEVAADLAAALAALERRTLALVVYRARDIDALPANALENLHAALFHSPGGARTFMRIAPAGARLSSVRAIAMSAAVAEALGTGVWAQIEVADEPNENALLARLAAAQG
jgi:uroporphyrinogen-III synthase